jgi:hypothetical protein
MGSNILERDAYGTAWKSNSGLASTRGSERNSLGLFAGELTKSQPEFIGGEWLLRVGHSGCKAEKQDE